MTDNPFTFLPEPIIKALNELSSVCRQHGLKLDALTIRKDRPTLFDYSVATPGGVVKLKLEP